MDHWSWKLITSLIYCRAVLKSFSSAWCGIAAFFMFRQQLLVHSSKTECSHCGCVCLIYMHAHCFLNWFGLCFVLLLLCVLAGEVYRCPGSSDSTTAQADTHCFPHWFGLYCVLLSLFYVRWKSLQVSGLQWLLRGTDGLPRLPYGPLQLPPLAEQQGSFLSAAAQRQQQQLQPKHQTQTQIQRRLEPSCRSLPRSGEPRWQPPAPQQADRCHRQGLGCGQLSG